MNESTNTRSVRSKNQSGIPGIPGPPIHNCYLCGKRISRQETAALVDSKGRAWRWCFDCWDNDPRAVEQYQTAGLEPMGNDAPDAPERGDASKAG